MTDTADAPEGAAGRAARTGGDRWPAPAGTPVPPAPAIDANGRHAGRTDVDRPHGLVGNVRAAISELDERIGAAELPFDSVRSGIGWWLRPVIEAPTWIAMASLFVGAIWGPVLFALVAVIFFPTFALVLGIVGILLIVPAFAGINALVSIERRRAGWVGEPIPPPTFARSAGGFWAPIATRLGDSARWRQLVFVLVFLLGGPVLFALGVAPWAALFTLAFDGSFFFGGFLLAFAVAGAAPRITLGVAWVGRELTSSLLGPSETIELQERVTELSGQREQILDAVSIERRRIERNLHDGVQQQLVALGIDIGRAKSRLADDPDGARELLEQATEKVRGSIGELRLIGRGLNPAVLDDRGLDAALSAVVANSPIPIAIDISTDVDVPDDVAATAYYVASEAVTNTLKHARARVGSIRFADDVLDGARAVRLTVHDDGRGGADEALGSGVVGMRARVEGMDGVFDVDSPAGGPTTLVAVIPLARRATKRPPDRRDP